MDTDDLTEMAWDIIVRAACVSDTLKAELGTLAHHYQTVDDWLNGVHHHLEDILNDPNGYVDYWDLENKEGMSVSTIGSNVTELCHRVEEILAVPLKKRGVKAW